MKFGRSKLAVLQVTDLCDAGGYRGLSANDGLERLLADRDLVAPDEIDTDQIMPPQKSVAELKVGEVTEAQQQGRCVRA
jgi:hypothetical protein